MNVLFRNIIMYIYKQFTLCKVPVHVGVTEYEETDKAAKQQNNVRKKTTSYKQSGELENPNEKKN